MKTVQVETIIWFVCVCLTVIARTISRRMVRGSFKNLQIDDFLILFATLCYTVSLIYIDLMAETAPDLNPELPGDNLTSEEIQAEIWVFKMGLIVEQMQMVSLWTVKASFLIGYGRLTSMYQENLYVKIVGVYTILGLIVTEILFFGVWCRPFDQYWAFPITSIQCYTFTNHLITHAVFNISSDILIFIIPIPILRHMPKLPTAERIGILFTFTVGVFTILVAALSKYYTLLDATDNWAPWYTREQSTVIIVGCLPYSWSLIRRACRWCSVSSSRSTIRQPSHEQKSKSQSQLARRRYSELKHDLENNNGPKART